MQSQQARTTAPSLRQEDRHPHRASDLQRVIRPRGPILLPRPVLSEHVLRRAPRTHVMIDGKEHPVVEIDYSTLHIAVAYSGSGKRKPRGDQHSIKGFDRCLVKLAVNILFNALTGDQARGAIAGELTRDPQLAAKSGIDSTDTKACRALAKRVVAAICRKHYRIKSYFGSDCGARFQRHDSDMAIEVMTRMMQTTKRCPLPVHDSFLAADIDADLLEETMTEVAGGHDLHLNVKRTEGAPPGPSPIWDPSLQIVNYGF